MLILHTGLTGIYFLIFIFLPPRLNSYGNSWERCPQHSLKNITRYFCRDYNRTIVSPKTFATVSHKFFKEIFLGNLQEFHPELFPGFIFHGDLPEILSVVSTISYRNSVETFESNSSCMFLRKPMYLKAIWAKFMDSWQASIQQIYLTRNN